VTHFARPVLREKKSEFIGQLRVTPEEKSKIRAALSNFALWLAGGIILRGWARSASGQTAQGIAWIETGIGDWRATGSMIGLPFWFALKAEALHLADRTSEALETITEAEILAKRSEERYWWAELHRLHGVFLAAIGADESQIENSFCEAIRTAKEQKSVSLAKRAEATYAEYHRQKASALDGRGFPITSLVTPSTIRTR